MEPLILGRLKVRIIILTFFSFFALLSSSEAGRPSVDILVLSPHPDDETLCCGGTILKAVQEDKKSNPLKPEHPIEIIKQRSNRVKVVFLTNGDAYPIAASAGLREDDNKLTPEEYIALGEKRQEEALQATKKLGLETEDVVFLSYPDNGLFSLWEKRYETNYRSETTKRTTSPYRITYKRARQGHTKENLLCDIKDILREYKPKRIYTPHPLDNHHDHIATTEFLNLALDELREKDKNKWIDKTEIFYYLVHEPHHDSSCSYILSQEPNYKEDIADFKNQKEDALKEYRTQMDIEEEKKLLISFIKDYELFWNVATSPQDYLKRIEQEWTAISRIMKSHGYNVNFAPAVDVVDDIEDVNIPLARKRRIYSEDPQIVTELASAVIRGMTKGGIIPVVKHFPGLGRVRSDTHVWLPEVKASKRRLYQRDLVPFKKLIKQQAHFWIMVDHAIYPCLSKEPASLSYKIQTELLREKLGFEGIIIVDELLVMQAVREYVFQQKIKEPYIGEIVSRAFQAGTDIALFYVTSPSQAKENISCIIEAVKKAVQEGRIKEKDIDTSVMRILKEKERIFAMPLMHLLKNMSLEEKIAQKLLTDVYCRTEEEVKAWKEICKSYNLAGIHARSYEFIEEFQKNSRIPMFVSGQHEGGLVNQYGLNLSTHSAYLIGREYERLVIKKRTGPRLASRHYRIRKKAPYDEQRVSFDDLDEATRQDIIQSIVDSIDELIGLFSELRQKGYVSPNPSSLSPLTIHSDGGLEIKPFGDLSMEWLRRFPNQDMALCAYQLFKTTFKQWQGTGKTSSCQLKEIISELDSLKQRIKERINSQQNKGLVRILCLAAHPDDEDGYALVYFKRKFNCPTYILLATRGEGGENEIDSSLYEELGALRTEEMERAASILGVSQVYYLGKIDFGYCVDSKEALQKWDRQDTLKKLVYFYRLLRPHIIITKHNKLDTNDHGQHQALAILAEEAFDLAGDPEAYPEMLNQGLSPWQPLKFYQRISGAGVSSTGKETVAIDVRERVAPENKMIHQIAMEALRQHRSQGGQWLESDEPGKIFYQIVKSKVPSQPQQEDSFLDGIQVERSLPVNSQDRRRVSPSGFPGAKIINPLGIGLIEKNNNVLFVALKTLGYDFKRLDEEFLKTGDLSQFDTIVVGQGAYTSFPAVAQANKRLLKFVKDGGNLVVFAPAYARKPFLYAPFPLKVSFNPIADENAPITILTPEHPLVNFPNKISTQDFEGWVQDRGLFFPYEYSRKYTGLISCLSPVSGEVNVGYLAAHYGKGSYIYTTFAWYRQLREFHLGAYKNLANMLAYCFAKK